MEQDIYLKLISVAAPVVIGVIIYFLKDTMNSHKKHGEKIVDIEKNYVKKEELEKKQTGLKSEITDYVREQIKDVKDDIKNLKDDMQSSNDKTAKAIDGLSSKISEFQRDYITKEDFMKQNLVLSSKIDKLMDMLIEEKTKNSYKNQI